MQFQREIENKNREIKKIIKDSKRLKIKSEIGLISAENQNQRKKFDAFYYDLEDNENFIILDYKNDYLQDIVNRAIYRIKPFTEEKSELKDAIIWKTYSEFVESNNTLDCILLTNNTSDFDQEGQKFRSSGT